jgi:hypothetical protein
LLLEGQTRPDSVFFSMQKCIVPLSNSLALRIYSDTTPSNQKIADLQKGLILVYNGIEAVGEGTGFGFPVLMYSDETYFSGSSRVYVCQQTNLVTIRKVFSMDRVARDKFRNVKLENRKVRTLLDYASKLYQKHKRSRFIALKTKGLLAGLGVQANFIKAPTLGEVIVTYLINQGRILVKVDFSLVKTSDLKKTFVLNEQSSTFFRVYSDSNKARLIDDEIGAWDPINAPWASISDLRGKVGFRLRQTENSVLRRGREFLRNSMDWVGLDYEVDPENVTFEYGIDILGV